MQTRIVRLFILAVFLSFALVSLCFNSQAQKSKGSFSPAIPRAWDDAELASLEVPLATPSASPQHVSADFYYHIPLMTIYKSYPVYAPGKEPPGYIEWIQQQEPEVAFDASKLETQEDWIKGGEVVFDAPLATGTGISRPDELYVRDPAWYRATGALVSRDGVMPFLRYVVKEKGKVELGVLSCAMCHTRVMPDGSVLKGAQGNFSNDKLIAYDLRTHPAGFSSLRLVQRMLYAAPWLKPDLQERLEAMPPEEVAAVLELIPPGVNARHGTSPLQPVQIPDLIGVKERKYLDHTGLQRHRSIVDLMRYATLNQTGDLLSRYGQFQPVGVFGPTPEPNAMVRYSDEMLYALALYVYSLQPPPNPNKFDALAARGQKIFAREGCGGCHTPPLYTNNKLTPAEGFTVPVEHRQKYDILAFSVGTDPTLALKTRRGTGYYKVPSLKGVWYRGPFEHSGSVATLEDWFDPRRLRDDYVPAGYKPYGVKTRAVKGHPFGLDLSAEDRRALIAFLKTL
jgi:hypothetical protein